MKYKFGVVKRITLLLMTMALAVAMVACQAGAPGEAGEPGLPGEPGPPGPAGAVPPRSVADIADASLMLAGPMATKTIDVTNNFDDPDAKPGDPALLVTATSSDVTIVTTSVAGMKVTITAVALGSADVTVMVTDKDSLTAKNTFAVTVAPSIPPDLIEKLPDVWLGTDHASEVIDLADHFSHSSEITYSAMSQDDSIATATIEGTMLTIASADTGTTRVVVTATADGQVETDGFQVAVRDHSVRYPYDMGELADIELTVGDTEDVDVSDNFADPDEQNLEVHASSSDEDVATVTVDGSTVTVTAVAAGTARIFVNVEDEDGLESDDLSFEVMVNAAPEPDPEPEPEPEDVTEFSLDVNGTKDLSVEEGQDVISGNDSVVTVKQKDTTTWTVTAVAKGEAEVQVYDGAKLVTTYTVTVNNQAPKRNTTKPATVYLLGDGAAGGFVINDYDPDAKLYRVSSLNLSSFFEDPDSGDTLSFTATSSNPRDVVVAAYKKDGSEIYVDVLDASNIHDFTITIGAMDQDGKKAADTVDVTVDISPVLSQTYTVKQNPVNHNLKAVDIGYRTGVSHMLRFVHSDNTQTDGGLEFADDFDTVLAGRSPTVAAARVTDIDAAPIDTDLTAAAVNRTQGAAWFNITGAIADAALAVDGTDTHIHNLSFKLRGSSSTTVTIKYNVITVAANPTATPVVKEKVESVMRTVQLNVKRVSEMPVTID